MATHPMAPRILALAPSVTLPVSPAPKIIWKEMCLSASLAYLNTLITLRWTRLVTLNAPILPISVIDTLAPRVSHLARLAHLLHLVFPATLLLRSLFSGQTSALMFVHTDLLKSASSANSAHHPVQHVQVDLQHSASHAMQVRVGSTCSAEIVYLLAPRELYRI